MLARFGETLRSRPAGRLNAVAQRESRRLPNSVAMQNVSSAPVGVEGLHFVMYLTDDLQRARTFYESLFGLQAGPSASAFFVEYDLPDGGAFALACVPDTPRVPSGGAMFGVADAEAAIARVEVLGGKLLARYGGERCTSGWCMDPEGNPFGVHQRK